MVHKIKKSTEDIWEKLDSLYTEGIPKYLKVVSKNKIQIKAGEWEGAPVRWITVTPKDVIDYYRPNRRMGASEIMSGARTLAGFTTDWRMVDNMAKESLEIFKILNRSALEKEGKKYGMELKD